MAVNAIDNPPQRYDNKLQRILLTYALSSNDMFEAARFALKPELFDDDLQRAVKFANEYFDETGSVIPLPLLNTKAKDDIVSVNTLNEPVPPKDWLIEQMQEFGRHQSLENLAFKMVEMLAQGKHSAIFERVQEAADFRNDNEFGVLEMEDLLARPRPDFLIPDMLFEQQTAIWYGAPGIGKSFVALAVASALAHGMTLSGLKMKPRRVLYVCGEGDAMMGLRRKAWLDFHKINVANDGLLVVPRAVNLLDQGEVGRFIKTMKRHGTFGLVVFDTLSTCMLGASEDHAEFMAPAIANASRIGRELGGSSLGIHHEGKEASRGARGSSSLHGNTDAYFHVARKDGIISVRAVKQKDGAECTFHFQCHLQMLGETDSYGRERSSLVAVECNPDEIDRTTLDRIAIAQVMEYDVEYSANGLLELLGFGSKGAALKRLYEAIPQNEPIKVLRHDEPVIITRTQVKSNNRLKMKPVI